MLQCGMKSNKPRHIQSMCYLKIDARLGKAKVILGETYPPAVTKR